MILWDLKTFAPRWVYHGEPAGVGVVAVDHADPRHLVVATSDGRLARLDAATGRVEVSSMTDPSGVRSYGRSPDGARILILTHRGQLQVRSAETLALLLEWKPDADDQAVAFFNDRVISPQVADPSPRRRQRPRAADPRRCRRPRPLACRPGGGRANCLFGSRCCRSPARFRRTSAPAP